MSALDRIIGMALAQYGPPHQGEHDAIRAAREVLELRQFRSDVRLMTLYAQHMGAVLCEFDDDGTPMMDEESRARLAGWIVENAELMAARGKQHKAGPPP